MIYVIGGMKFSLSKVRTSVDFALYLSTVKKRNVILLDTDKTAYSSKYITWLNKTTDFKKIDSLKIEGSQLSEEITKIKESYDDIIIDSGVGETLIQSLKIANRFIVPFNAKDLGLWAVWTQTNIETIIDRTLEHNSTLKSYSFLISKTGQENSVKGISKVLRNSQYLTFLESTPFQNIFEENGYKVMESLKDMKNCSSLYSLGLLVDEISN
jgi:cellulose biosynthesis protein BcsQ